MICGAADDEDGEVGDVVGEEPVHRRGALRLQQHGDVAAHRDDVLIHQAIPALHMSR